jgi:uncharacterized membrane protein
MPDNQKTQPPGTQEPEPSQQQTSTPPVQEDRPKEQSAQPQSAAQNQTQPSAGVPSSVQGPITVSVPLPGLLLAAASQPQGAFVVPAVQTQQTLQVWQGQYPPPDAVERYDKVLPGAFDRIVRMVEQLQAAQIDTARRAQEYLRADTRRGHWLGWSIAILAMGAALAALWLGNAWVAGLFVGIPVMTIARALIETTKSQSSVPSTATTTTSQPAPQPPPTRPA